MDHQASSTRSAPRKIAILGGGMAALTTAFELTECGTPYDITVYQMGWRLGGKGASGRNLDPDYHSRIEEHGLHVWTGLYDNAFRVIRRCYANLQRPADAELATWQSAFKPHHSFVLKEFFNGRWVDWNFRAPTNDQLPGEPGASMILPLRSYALMAFDILREALLPGPQGPRSRMNTVVPGAPAGKKSGWRSHLPRLRQMGHGLRRSLLRVSGVDLLRQPARVLNLLGRLMARRWQKVRPQLENDIVRRQWITLNFVFGNLRGFFADNILEHGFAAIEDQDYRCWLRKYIIDDTIYDRELTLCSPLAWFLYDAGFAYVGGDLKSPDLAAGTALRTLIRMTFTWKGALVWKMQAGMGDVVFAPLYQVLRQRGVKFKFFHRVKRIQPHADGATIATIEIGRQVDLCAAAEQYEPLIDVKGLQCWPATPLYDQIEADQARRLRTAAINLEGGDERWTDAEELTLRAGVDFDAVVLGIPIGALPAICQDLLAIKPAWRQMVSAVKTVRTQALQLWLARSTAELGWRSLPQPILCTYGVGPINTWADMSYLLEREDWPAAGPQAPRHNAYFCGPLADPEPQDAGGTAQQQAALALALVRRTGLEFLQQHIGHLWPQATTGPASPELDWGLLVDQRPEPGRGPDRLDAQYWRANIEPSERYVLTVSGSTSYRMKPGESGFENLYLAGDWTDNGFSGIL